MRNAKQHFSKAALCGLAGLSIFLYLTIIQPYHASRRRMLHEEQEEFRYGLSSTAAARLDLLINRHHSGHGDHMGEKDCLAANLLIPPTSRINLPSSSSTSSLDNYSKLEKEKTTRRPIPLLATNLDYDTEGYLTRLVDGWGDHPAKHNLIVAGGCDPLVLAQLKALQTSHPDLTVYREREPLGCAPGWNRILDYMTFNEDIEWALVSNTDIYIPPGALEKLAGEIWTQYDRDPLFCRGFFDVRAGQDAVVFVFTRHALEVLGHYDENIYPAYYEDYDMDLRHNRTELCSPVARFTSATMHHGPLKGNEYISGTSVIRERMSQAKRNDKETKKRLDDLTNRLERGSKSSQAYISLKWGCNDQQEECIYLHPFNNPAYPLSYWRLDWQRRLCIHRKEKRIRGCAYALDEPIGGPPYPYVRNRKIGMQE